LSGRLEGRVACVTGAAGGLGVTIVEVLRREGAHVVSVDIQGEGCLHLDIGTSEGNRAMTAAALERHGRLDVLVLNAGAQHVAPIAEHSEAEWDRLFDVMVKGPWLAMKHAWPHIARPGGRVVVTASGSSYIAEQFKAAYVAAKHAVLGLVRVAALEGGPLGMTVNAVGPGWMRTPMVERQLAEQMRLHGLSREEVVESMVDRHPVKRFVEPVEVANTIAFLASDEASGINGSFAPFDLGTLAC
jgi:3-hydroxybutyrate dehydrogenase